MKIMRLDLIACGPFTDLSLELGRGKEGLHLIYGPNEAGKSSALRALGYFLFGIPDRCEDDFKHPYQKLRIGGALRTGSGRIIEAIRRKGRANTLRAPDDSLLDEALWHEACGKISAAEFSRRFGIDHNALVQGGSEIVEGEGELSDVLFSAGAGLASFRKIEELVREEANELFKPGGQRPKINELLSTLKEKQKDLRELQLPNEKWDAHSEACQAALANRAKVEAELERAEQERNRLKRLRAALPLLGRRKTLLMELCAHASTVILPEGFSEKRQKAVQDLRLEEQNVQQAKQRIETLRTEFNGLKSPSAVLDFSQEISELYLRLGSHRKAQENRPKLTVKRKAYEDQARELLGELRRDFPFERVEELRLRADEEIVIRNLGAKREKYTTNLENALEKTRELTVEIGAISERLAAIPVPGDTGRLQTAIEEARSCGRIEEELSQIEVHFLRAEEQANIDLAGLELWTGSLEELERLKTPDMETIEEFAARMRETSDQIGYQSKELEKLAREIRTLETRLSALRAGEVVSLDDLDNARTLRETGWKLVRRVIEGEEVHEEERNGFVALVPGTETLPDAFEKSVLIADELCDRLRREAKRVAEYNNLVSTGKALALERNEVLGKKERIEKIFEQIGQDWTNLWLPCGFRPHTPARMRKWETNRSELVRKKMELRSLWGEAQYRSNRIEELKGVIGQCLQELGQTVQNDQSLREMVAEAQHLLETQSAISTERDRLEKELQQKKHELRKVESRTGKAKDELQEWRNEWATALSPLGLGGKSIPEQANVMLAKLQEIFARLKDAKSLAQQMEEIDTDCRVFEKQAAELVSLAAPELHGRNTEEAVRGLNELMTTARAEKNKKEDLTKKIVREEKELPNGLGRIDKLKFEISGMLAEAACSEIEALPDAERRSAMKKDLLAQLAQIDEQLIELAAGQSIEQFRVEVEGRDPDLLQPLLANLDENIARLKADKSDLDQTIGSEKNELSRWDGRGDAAELAQQIQAHLADLENSARQYARLRIAHALLLRAKERHREMSQGPVIKRTSELFGALTLGAFEGIRAGDDAGRNVIVGLRRGGDMVPVRAMSEGTADQLYLALRLASFEHHVLSNEPLPLVLDDILVQFDNERSRAALRVLGEVSKITQLIMFTHHSHLVELARSELGSERLFVLELP
ncbi:MAG: AAA family ATPase [Syntrophobacteraceae bacterium]|nr:AAA family ATPase [Syntrophobacteraceae bacterium]